MIPPHKRRALVTLTSVAALGAGPALAQDAGSSTPIELDTLVVTGAPVARSIADLPADIAVVAGSEKRRLQRASLGDTLKHLSGVDTISTSTNVGKPVLRGFSGNRVRVLSNGIGLDFQQFGVRHMPTVDPFIADRIEVVRGAQSLLYGSGALGGAVNMLPDLPPTGPEGAWVFGGETTLEFESAYEQITGVQKLNGATGRLGFAATLVARESDGLNTPNGSEALTSGNPSDPLVTGSVPFTDYEQLNGDINIGYMTDIGQVRLRYERYRDEHNFVVPNPGAAPPLRPGGVGQQIENDLVQLDADLAISDIWTLKPSLTYASNLRLSNPGPPNPVPLPVRRSTRVIDIERDTITARIEGAHVGLFGVLDGRVGIEVVDTDQTSRGSTILSPGGQIENYALFAFEEARIGDVTLNFGGRVDYRETRLDLGQTSGTFPNGTPPPGQRENDYLVATWGLGASYAVSEQLSILGNLSTGFRAPNLFELYADGVHGGVAAVQRGDPTLDEETSISVDAGLRWESETLSASATAYYNDIEDYIFLADTGTLQGTLPVFQVSQQDAELYGADLTLEGRPMHWLTWRTTLSWVDGELSDGTQTPLLPPLRVTGEVTFSRDRLGAFEDTYLTLAAEYAGSQDSAGLLEPFGQCDGPRPPPFGTASTDDYMLLDARIGGTFAATGTEVQFGVENILDEEYRDFLDTYKIITLGAGRNWTLRVTHAF